MFKLYEKKNNNEKYFFIGFNDYTNFGHGSETDVISTNDKRYQLNGTQCYDISGHQCFLIYTIKEVLSIENELEQTLLEDALVNSGLNEEQKKQVAKKYI